MRCDMYGWAKAGAGVPCGVSCCDTQLLGDLRRIGERVDTHLLGAGIGLTLRGERGFKEVAVVAGRKRCISISQAYEEQELVFVIASAHICNGICGCKHEGACGCTEIEEGGSRINENRLRMIGMKILHQKQLQCCSQVSKNPLLNSAPAVAFAFAFALPRCRTAHRQS